MIITFIGDMESFFIKNCGSIHGETPDCRSCKFINHRRSCSHPENPIRIKEAPNGSDTDTIQRIGIERPGD